MKRARCHNDVDVPRVQPSTSILPTTTTTTSETSTKIASASISRIAAASYDVWSDLLLYLEPTDWMFLYETCHIIQRIIQRCVVTIPSFIFNTIAYGNNALI